MKVRIYEFGNLIARRTSPARIAVMFRVTIQILEKRHYKSKGPATFIFMEHHGMRHPAAVSHPDQSRLDLIISYDIRKLHDFLSAVNSAMSANLSASSDFPRGLNDNLALSTYS